MDVPLSPAVDDGPSLSAAERDEPRNPRVSVVLATYQGAKRIGTCLATLLDQSLLPEEYEVVVVQNGPPCETSDLVRSLRAQHPRHHLRLLETLEPGAGRARNLGIDAARGTYVTFVDDDDWVSRDYLAGLLASAAKGVVPAAYVADVAEGSTPQDAEPSFENYISSRLLPLSGRTVPVVKAAVSISANAGKLLPTAVARLVRYEENLASGEDFLFWHQAAARTGFKIAVTPREAGAVYYRTVRTGSVSRRELGYDFNVTGRLDCIEILNRTVSDAPGIAKLTRWQTSAQAEHICAYLLAHPDERDTVTADIARRGLQDVVPWRTINAGQARDLAILYCFTPYLDTSGLVAARRLRARGVITDVIAQQMDNIRTLDWGSSAVAREFLDVVRYLPGTASFDDWALTRQFVDETLLEVAELQAAKGPYRTVYSRSMATASHFAAAVVKIRNPGIRWTAEFSDPNLINILGQERQLPVGDDALTAELLKGIERAGFAPPPTRQMYAWAEILPYALADEIVFTNENQQQLMMDYCHDPALVERVRSISSVSHHPTLPKRFYEMAPYEYPLDPDVVHIGYFGVFYLTRGLTEVTAALESLSRAERRRVCLHIFTDKPDQLALDVLQRGLDDVIRVNDYVPFLAFLNLTLQFDALLVNDANTGEHHSLNPYLPSKISDYRGSGTPVWAITEAGSVLSTLETAYTSSLGDEAGAARVIGSLIEAGPRARNHPKG